MIQLDLPRANLDNRAKQFLREFKNKLRQLDNEPPGKAWNDFNEDEPKQVESEERSDYCLVRSSSFALSTGSQGVAFYDFEHECWFDSFGDRVHNVTHWMYLPEDPIEKELKNERHD
ncbi:hypothetical protein [Oligella sp. MSHR50489EDL]|uniref:hypothetical protein n=1 Tax=Oligella sp. MSHR50489EDL TaxID=3139409 RepID=UPI003D8194B2